MTESASFTVGGVDVDPYLPESFKDETTKSAWATFQASFQSKASSKLLGRFADLEM